MRDYPTLKLRALIPVAVLGLPIAVVAVLLANMQSFPLVQELVSRMRDVGREWWAVPLFLIVYCLLTLFLLPVGMLSAAAALAWGWQIGGLLDLIASTVASIGPFLIARNRLPKRVQNYLAKHGMTFETTPDFFPLLILRIVPIVPYVALNYIGGLARFRFRDFVTATLLGSIPSCFLFAFFIDTLGDSAMGAATQLRILGACAAVAALAIIGRVGVRYATRIVRRTGGEGR